MMMTWCFLFQHYLRLSTLGKKFSRQHSEIFFLFFPRRQVLTFHAICMKCQVLFSGKTKKNIILLSAELSPESGKVSMFLKIP